MKKARTMTGLAEVFYRPAQWLPFRARG